MGSASKHFGLLLLVAAFASGCGARRTAPTGQSALKSPQQIAAQFNTAQNDRVRRDMILRAIDQGTIRRGMTVSDLHAILGIGDGGSPESDSGLTQVIYDLAPQHHGLGFVGSTPPQPFGWYFVVQHNGIHVQNYFLSDVHMK